MRTGLRVNFVKVHKVNNIIIDCAARNAEPFRKIIDAIFFICMLNLVDGTRAVLRSKSDEFPPLELHYAETCIVPQAAGDYEIYSPDGSEVKVILACVRN